MAFWIMLSVSLSGSGALPLRSNSSWRLRAEISLRESREAQAQMTEQLAQQKLISPGHLKALFKLPTAEQVVCWPAIFALFYIVIFDIARPATARIRRRIMGLGEIITTLGGLLPSKNARIEQVIALAREQSLALETPASPFAPTPGSSSAHVVHKPFSYSFAVLGNVHITVAMMLGFM